ncbi:MAG: hypothetical protein M0R06_04555 [Sphaerochaeta sp.]|nr:hypothetical protein [Sphaerochaeta sp.]
MTSPKLTVAASNMGGRGYRTIFEPEPGVVPGVTTVLNAISIPAIVQWAVDNTCAYYAANPEAVYVREAEATYFMGRWHWNKTPDYDSPEYNPHNYHAGVLQDAADQGDFIHQFIEADLNGWFEPTPQNAQHEQMIGAYLDWRANNDVEMLMTERTVFGDGYAGSFDWMGYVNGAKLLIDNKSSRAIRETHVGQLAALGAAHTMAVEVKEGTEGARHHKLHKAASEGNGGQVDSWWVPEPLPPFQGYAVLQVRPDDVDEPAFCRLEIIPDNVIDSGWKLFRGALEIKRAQRELDVLKKGGEW